MEDDVSDRRHGGHPLHGQNVGRLQVRQGSELFRHVGIRDRNSDPNMNPISGLLISFFLKGF